MIILEAIFPLSDFVRNTKAHITRLVKSGQPEILTVNGKAEAVVLSADAFQKMLNELETATIQNTAHQNLLEMFRSGQISAEQLRRELRPAPHVIGKPIKEAFAELDRRINVRRKKKAS